MMNKQNTNNEDIEYRVILIFNLEQNEWESIVTTSFGLIRSIVDTLIISMSRQNTQELL